MPLFFSLMYYTQQARDWADEVGIALFRFNEAAEPEAVNDAAHSIIANAPDADADAGDEFALPHAVIEPYAIRAAARVFGDAERLHRISADVDVRTCWIPSYCFYIDYSVREAFGLVHRELQVVLDSRTLNAMPVSKDFADWARRGIADCAIDSLFDLDDAREHLENRLSDDGLYASERTESEFARMAGIPQNAEFISVNHNRFPLLYPIFVARLTVTGGRRVVVIDGNTGFPNRVLSEEMTASLHFVERDLDHARRARPVSAAPE
jgi:hypothetical protein